MENNYDGSPEELRGLFDLAGSRIFSVTFMKANGDLRTMSARLGVYQPKNAKAPQGIGDRQAEDRYHGTMTVYDMNADARSNSQKGGYRRFKLSSLKSVKINGTTYKV